ncbi:hypothetical protein DFH09DRAFT_1218689 [Mycena vulgaris]|nr:hypothetical protein DFH09DRAFT_1218689 [Mycena vulgaris]
MRAQRPSVRVRSGAGVRARVAWGEDSERADAYYPQVLVADAYPCALGDDVDVHRDSRAQMKQQARGMGTMGRGRVPRGFSSPRMPSATYARNGGAASRMRVRCGGTTAKGKGRIIHVLSSPGATTTWTTNTPTTQMRRTYSTRRRAMRTT